MVVLGAILYTRPRVWNYVVHGLTAVSSLVIMVLTGYAFATGYTASVAITPPRPLTFFPVVYLTIDPLSSFMILVVALLSFYSSIFAIGYVDHYFTHRGKLAILGLCYPSFIASMILVALAGDVILFLVAWEIMTVTSFFLILTDFEDYRVRRAALTYLVYAVLSAVCLLAAFALGYAVTGSLVFREWRSSTIPPAIAYVIFLLALVGFSAKGGVVPLHSWLPEAHPAAPSHVSALLSGVMVKLAMYGIIRVALDALAPQASVTWGLIVLALGAISTFYGVALAVVQHDVKRLLAYHTIENIGIIMLGIGACICAYAAGLPGLAILGLAAGLFHLINHALFKSLLFLCSGALLHQLHTRDIDRMGGLYRKLRATAIAFLIAALGITAMPMFNGFASEWCTYNALMLTVRDVGDVAARFAALMSIASLSAAGVLAVYCFTKVYGLAFLGRPRSPEAAEATPEPLPMKLSYILPAALIVGLGLVPGIILQPLSNLGRILLHVRVEPLEVPGLGILVNLWDTPSMFIPLLLACIVGVICIASIMRLSSVRYVAVTEPFVSGVAYEDAMQPTASLYVSTYKELMARLYGVQKVYERDYAVRYWTASRVRVMEVPTATLEAIIRRLGYRIRDVALLPEKLDDLLTALFRLMAKAVTGFARVTTEKLECGRLHVYLAYIYVSFFLLLVYYLLVR